MDDNWGTATVPADLRISGNRAEAGAVIVGGEDPGEAIRSRLVAGVERVDSGFTQRWDSCSKEAFMVVTTPSAAIGCGPVSRWRVDLAARTVTAAPLVDDEDSTAWDVVGSAGAWQAASRRPGQPGRGHPPLRPAVLRHRRERAIGRRTSGIEMLADLLGLAPSWQVMPRRADLPLADVR